MLLLNSFLRRTPDAARRCTNFFIKCNYCAAQDAGSSSDKRGLILGVYDDNGEPVLTKSATKYNDHLQGKLMELVREAGPKITNRGEARAFNNIDPDYWSTCLVGLGAKNQGFNEMESIDEDREAVRVASAMGSLHLQRQGCSCIMVEGFGFPEQAAEGGSLAVWRYQELKNKKGHQVIPQLELFDDPSQDAFQRGLFKADSQNLVRRMADMPANIMTPLHFAQITVDELCPCGIKVDVHDKDWIETKKMNAFLTVARGSCAPPLFLEVQYCGGPADMKPVLMVGKGVTFDAGGLCLKNCTNMDAHRANMAGAATIVAVIRAAAALSLPLNIVGCVPLCENMPSGMAMKCGDIVMGLNGKSIRIKTTDHEGRLALADAFVYGQETYKPRLIVDVATMSRGTSAALGSAATAVFSNSHSMWKQLHKAGVVSGDRVWRMPLWKHYTKNVTKLPTQDVCNKGRGEGTPCLGAAFLQEFVQCVDWLHLDIHGVGKKCTDKAYPYLRKGRMTGRPTRTLIQFLYQLSCPEENKEKKEC